MYLSVSSSLSTFGSLKPILGLYMKFIWIQGHNLEREISRKNNCTALNLNVLWIRKQKPALGISWNVLHSFHSYLLEVDFVEILKSLLFSWLCSLSAVYTILSSTVSGVFVSLSKRIQWSNTQEAGLENTFAFTSINSSSSFYIWCSN